MATTTFTNWLPFLLLFVALLTFHDTANAVATVIYTRALPANVAVATAPGEETALRIACGVPR
jgi:phosphate/sulfate permease